MNKLLCKLVILLSAICFTKGNQCVMQGVENWLLEVPVDIMDTDREVEIFRRTTENIEEITGVTQGEALNNGPYLTMTLVDSSFVISTNVAFNTYENYETSLSIGSVIQFRCTSGSISVLVITVRITDTNNHSPEFVPPSYEFTIAPPVPPGFLVTDCVQDVIARDVDLTTYRIDFEIEGSDLFEIAYDESTEPKNFKAMLRTVTFIRTIPEPIVLRVKATDVDRTGNEQRSVESTITIHANSEFEFPDEPIFSQAYYLATYTEENQLELRDTIHLRQGFDDQVTFSLDGDLKQYFQLEPGNNEISFQVLSPIPIEEYPENGQTYLVVIAERLYTSGAVATVIVQLPRETENEAAFDKVLYIGQLRDNVVTHETITVSNYDASPVLLSGDYAQLFEATTNANGVVTVDRILSGTIPVDVTSIPLEMTAGTASAVLVVNVITDGPVENRAAFDKLLYMGQFQENVATHEEITVLYHDGSPVLLSGVYAQYFAATILNGVVTVTSSSSVTIPDGITNIPLQMTTGSATAVLVLNIITSDGPSENRATFDKILYIGQIDENTVTHEAITIINHDGSSVLLSGVYAQSFEAAISNGVVTVTRISSGIIPEDITSIHLEMRAGSASAVLVLSVTPSDVPSENTVAFDKVLYIGQLQENVVTHETITVLNHYGSPVLLSGVYAQFFEATTLNGVVTVTSSSSVTIPDGITNIPLQMTTGSATAVLVLNIITSDGPSENRATFDKILYIGQIEENTVTHEAITIINHDGSSVLLSGVYAQSFEAAISNGVVTVTRVSSGIIPEDITSIHLEMRAGSASAVLVLSVTPSDVPSENTVAFDKVLYIGQLQENVVTHETITVLHHYGSPVLLSGVYAQFFEATTLNGVVTVTSSSSVTIPDGITNIPLQMTTGSATAVLVLNIITSDGPSENRATFDKILYIGQIEENTVTHEAITIINHDGSSVLLSGVYAQSFEAAISNGVVTVTRVSSGIIPEDITSIHLEMRAGSASAVLVLSVTPSDVPSENTVAFDKVLYIGQLQENVVTHETITVLHHYGSPVLLSGVYAQFFEATTLNGVVTVTSSSSVTIPDGITNIPLQMTTGSATAVLVLNIITSDGPSENRATFDKILYIGQIKENTVTHEAITIINHDGSSVLLSGVYAQSFEAAIYNGVVTVTRVSSGIIPEDITSIHLEMRAGSASAVLVLSVTPSDVPSENTVAFDKVLYIGQLQENVVTHETITVLHHYGSPVLLSGVYAQFFEATTLNGVVTVTTSSAVTIPDGITNIPLQMTTGSATAVLVLNIITSDGPSENRPTFDKILYIGQIEENTVTHEAITIINHDGSSVLLSGVYAQSFEAAIFNGVVTVTRVSSGIIPEDITSIHLEMRASSASAVLVLSVTPSDVPSENTVAFDKVLYIGQLQENVVTHETITVLHHYGSPVLLSGVYAQFFEATTLNGVVTVTTTSAVTIPDGITNIPLQMTTGSATAVLVLNIITSDGPSENRATFDKVLYTGQIDENIVTHEAITVINHDGSPVLLSEGYAQLFEATISNGVVTVARVLSAAIPEDITSILLEMRTGSASAVLVLSVTPSVDPSENRAAFEKVLYIGQFQENVVTHETITVSHHDGSPVILSREYAQLFEASISNGIVTVTSVLSSVTIPEDITSIPLEMSSGEASAVLILIIIQSEQPVLPTVTFSSSSYTIRTDVSQTGVIGTVHATADNGEPIVYSLLLDNDHLQERLSVNSEGAVSLSAPAASGGYNFQVQATSIVNRVSAVAVVSLWVEAVTICDTDIVLQPLIVIERLEEEPHRNLVILNQQQYAGCEFELTNHWPREQNWLYVDAEGLHAAVIDREHESIAFMHVSQVQVELVLHCENDSTRRKRSLEPSPDYGSKSWILTDNILYNSRRSLVNLIVIDINDNAPVFVGKDKEPIYVGYPTNDLEDTILPRSLVELKATDADIGENAEILYWSAEENLAVAPTTGFVHVRQSVLLEDDSRFTIHATDQNGRGLDGTIDIVVKLLDENHIAVVTVSDAFLDDEQSIITDISTALGYDVKILNAAVVSDASTVATRKRRETDPGASLQLYVYGIEDNNAVHVNQLTSDINSSDLIAVSIARVLSLEDHLLQICPLPGRDTALLAATISLAVLLFLIITMITVREFLKRKKGQPSYEQFSDTNSLASRNNSIHVVPKLESPERPRLNIGELRKSEKRLQDMLNEDTREPVEKKEIEKINESIIDMPIPLTPEPEQQKPIVIQSIDKLKDSNDDSDGDEYGEVKNNRRKSVVTFNENVEKIIHIEDRSASISSDSTDFEVYKF